MPRPKIYSGPDRRRERYKARQRAEFESYRALCRCAICGAQGPDNIEFHHTDPDTKRNNVGRMVSQGHAWATVRAEIDLTVPLCRPCHEGLHAGDLQLSDEAIEAAQAVSP